MYHQLRTFANGYVIILIIMIGFALTAFYTSNNADSSSTLVVTNQLKKINLSQKLSAVISERTQLTQSLLLKGSKSIKVKDWQLIEQFDQSFNQVKQQLLPLLDAREREHLDYINNLNNEISDLNRQVSVLFLNGSQREAKQILLNDVLSKTKPLLDKLSELITAQHDIASKAMHIANQFADTNRFYFILSAIFSIFISLIVAALAMHYEQKLSRQLEEMNDYLEEKVSQRTESLLDTQKELLEDNTELTRLASTDPLTGLFNRTYLNDILKREYSRFQRHGHQFGVILIDIDHFKQVNDTHGHDVGDKVLTHIAQQFKSAVRISNFIGRWGGEEFLICCTSIGADDIQSMAENIRNNIYLAEFDVIDKLTISLGCAIIQSGETIESLIKRSDIALYEAKNNGRNQTMVSTMEPLTSTPDVAVSAATDAK